MKKPVLLSMDAIEEKESEWLIPQYIPKGQITTLAGDGGSGKTMIWCSIAAAVSSGKRVFFDSIPEKFARCEPQIVLFFSSEDSIEHTLRARLRKAGANLKNIFSVSLKDEAFSSIKFNSTLLKDLILEVHPALVIFDPIQSFIPPDVQMGQRNAMRACLNGFVGLGESVGVTSLIVVHTNKRQGVYGRNRMADSADIWDISRSVLIAGECSTEKGKRYLSHEKSNYGPLGETTIFTIDDGVAVFSEFSDKKDVDFVKERDYTSFQAPQRRDAEQFIMDFLRGGKKPTAELDEAAQASGISKKTLERAKTQLRQKGILGGNSEGFGQTKKFYSYLKEQNFH